MNVRLIPRAFAALLLVAAAGCSSHAEQGDLAPYDVDTPAGSEGGDDDDADEPADPPSSDDAGGTGDLPGDDDGNDLPPEPDGDGVDNSSDELEICDAEQESILFLAPDDSNAMSSPMQVREAVLSDHGGVQSVPIRPWEFLNHYRFDYPAAEAGTLAIAPALRPLPGGSAEDFELQVGISSEFVTTETRAPVSLTLVLDTSGSMAGEAMDLVTETAVAIAASLRQGDTISIVTWAASDAVVLEHYEVSGANDAGLLAAIDGLEAAGGSDLHRGLQAGYALAGQGYDPSRTHRLVLVSDGSANVGVADIELITEHAGGDNEDGIYMVGVGVGDAASYHDDLMQLVTDAGKGASVFVGNADQAWAVFHDDFISTMTLAARDVDVELSLPPGFEVVRAGDPEAGLSPTTVKPQHLAPNDAMIFHQGIRTCAPQLLNADATIEVTVRYRDALTFEPRQRTVSRSIASLLAETSPALLKGAAVIEYARALKSYKYAAAEERPATFDPAFSALSQAERVLPQDPDLAEIRAVLSALADR